jgi:hypothetical protein
MSQFVREDAATSTISKIVQNCHSYHRQYDRITYRLSLCCVDSMTLKIILGQVADMIHLLDLGLQQKFSLIDMMCDGHDV